MSSAAVRGFVRRVISRLPLKLAIVRAGALLPPFIRNQWLVRFFSAVARHGRGLPAELETNLGIDRKLRVSISSAKTQLLFGAPPLFIAERSTLDLAVFALQQSDCFLDVGSNVGLFTYYLRSRDDSGKPVYFFEPDPALFAGLERNVRNNAIRHVKGFQAAMAEQTGRATFYQNRTDDSSGTIIREDWLTHELEPIDVDQISLDDFSRAHDLKNIAAKVDVEGAEERFYQGATRSLHELRYLLIEILGPAVRRGFPRALITGGGFEAYYINDYELQHSPSGEFTYVEPFYNWLFCRDSPAALRRKLQGTRFRVAELLPPPNRKDS